MQKNNIQTGIWLIGIGILALTNFWWPGIMFVIGVSTLASGSIQGAVWLFGIGILAWFDFWWPGILFLIGLGIIAEAILPDRKRKTPTDTVNEPIPDPSASAESPQSSGEFPDPPQPLTSPTPHPTPSRAWLPSRCPACGAPITSDEVVWHDAAHAECPYCYTQLSPT